MAPARMVNVSGDTLMTSQGGLNRFELEEGDLGPHCVGLGTITRGGEGARKMVLRDGGAPRGGYKGGIGGVGGLGNYSLEPRPEGIFRGGNKRVSSQSGA